MDITTAQARDYNLKLVVDFVRPDGELATIDGPHEVSSSNPDIASVMSQQEVDMHHEVVYELHPVAGAVVLSGFGDADLGDGIRNVSWEFELNVMADEAEAAHVSAGELIPKSGPPE